MHKRIEISLLYLIQIVMFGNDPFAFADGFFVYDKNILIRSGIDQSRERQVNHYRKEVKMLAIRKANKLMCIAFAGMIALFGLSILTTAAYADEVSGAQDESSISNDPVVYNNHQDQWFRFRLTAYHNTDGTSYEDKKDRTPTYVKAERMGIPCQLFVDAPDGTNCTVNGRAYLNQSGEYFIDQNVYEWGWRSCHLTSWMSVDETWVEGYWSPDSVGWYPSINA